MNESMKLLLVLFAAIAVIIVMIVRLRIHAFLALLAACLVVGIGSGMPLSNIADSFERGMGSTLGFLAGIIGLGSILGKILEDSGGAERIARTLLTLFGPQRASWVMMLVGFIAGIPVFFEVGFILLIPLIYVIARETKLNLLYLGVPLAVSLMAVHCMLPPHPAAMAIIDTLHADVGKVILYGLVIGLPTAAIAGPIWIRFACDQTPTPTQKIFLDTNCSMPDEARNLPGFGITLLTIVLPLVLMIARTVTRGANVDGHIAQICAFIGDPLIALTIAVTFAYWSLGLRRGATMAILLESTQKSLPPIASILLIIGAGGAFNGMLIDSGVGKTLANMLAQSELSPIFLAWAMAGIMHFAIGSATVAMMSAAGIVLPLLASNPTLRPEIMVIAIGAGAIGFTHVTDSAFWVVKEYSGVSLSDALKKFTAGTTLASVVALGLTLLLSAVIH